MGGVLRPRLAMTRCQECERVSRYMANDPELYRGEERACTAHRSDHRNPLHEATRIAKRQLSILLRKGGPCDMSQRSDRPTARERAKAIALHHRSYTNDDLDYYEREILDAERTARAEGFREGQERMRERCQALAEPKQVWNRNEVDPGAMWMRTAGREIAAAIRALPLEVDDE